MQTKKKSTTTISRSSQSGLLVTSEILRNGAKKFAKRYGKVIKQLAKE